jgi:hypothetical protein
VGLLQDAIDRFLAPILARVKVALGPFGKLIDFVQHFFDRIKQIIPKGRQLSGEIFTEVVEWKRFKEAIPFRTGVISLPAAISQTQDLIDQLVAAWHAVLGLARKLRDKALRGGEGDPVQEAEEAFADIEKSGVQGILERFPRLAKGFEKILAWLAIVITILDDLIEVTDDLLSIVAACRAIREEVETGSTVFLSQKNKRRTVTTTDGEKLVLRVGNLHS